VLAFIDRETQQDNQANPRQKQQPVLDPHTPGTAPMSGQQEPHRCPRHPNIPSPVHQVYKDRDQAHRQRRRSQARMYKRKRLR